MKYINFYLPYIGFLFFTFLGLLLWDLIIINIYPAQDFIRFYTLIAISLIPTYFLLKKDSKNFYSISETFFLNKYNQPVKSEINFVYYLIIFIIIISFLTLNPEEFYNLDLYHDGFSLTPSMNYLETKSIWGSSFIEAGLYPNFRPLIITFFTGKLTIGSKFFLSYLIIFLNKFLLVTLIKLILDKLNFNKNYKIIFLILFSILALSLAKYDDTTYFPERYFLYLVFFIFLYFNFFYENKKELYISSFLLGGLSVLSIFWYFDIFIFINLSFTFYLLCLFYLKKINKIKYLILSLIFFVILFFLFFPKNELIDFFRNNYFILFEINKFTFIEYPSPLSLNDGRASKTLMLFPYSGLLLMLIVMNKNLLISKEIKIFFIILFISSLICFLYGLGRSDSYHIIYSTGLLMFILALFHLILLFFYMKKRQVIFNKIPVYLISFILILFVGFYQIDRKKIDNIKNFNKNVQTLILYDDKFYLRDEYKDYLKLKSYYNNILGPNECVQIFTDETLIPYFLKRKTCTKYFFYHILGSQKLQDALIFDLKKIMPKYILYDSELFTFNFIKKLYDVNDFINSNYEFHEKYLYWTFYKLKT